MSWPGKPGWSILFTISTTGSPWQQAGTESLQRLPDFLLVAPRWGPRPATTVAAVFTQREALFKAAVLPSVKAGKGAGLDYIFGVFVRCGDAAVYRDSFTNAQKAGETAQAEADQSGRESFIYDFKRRRELGTYVPASRQTPSP